MTKFQKLLELSTKYLTALNVLVAVAVLLAVYLFRRSSRVAKAINSTKVRRTKRQLGGEDYDVIVVGGSISGTATSIRFARMGRRVLVVEKDLGRPDTIIGELMQPGGMEILRRMKLEHCAADVGVPAEGYVAAMDGRWIDLPFDKKAEGVSFHHGDFVMQLRRAMLSANEKDAEVKQSGGRITVVEGVVEKYLHEADDVNTVCGVRYRARVGASVDAASASSSDSVTKKKGKAVAETPASGVAAAASAGKQAVNYESTPTEVTAGLVVCCDGNQTVLRPPPGVPRTPHSHFVGMILRNVKLRSERRGNVILGRKGIILSYRLDPSEVRLLIDWGRPGQLPSQRELIAWLRNDMKPELPTAEMREAFEDELKRAEAGEADAVRARPHLQFSPLHPALRGCVGIGDHCVMRHPLTGAGMTVALRDAFFLTESIAAAGIPKGGSYGSAENRPRVQRAIRGFFERRHEHSSVMNVLSWALYGVFSGPMSIRHAVMEYFYEGGDAVTVPLKMLAGLEGRFSILLGHYIRTMVAGAKFQIAGRKGERNVLGAVTFFVNPLRIAEALYLAVYATCLFGYVSWVEFISPWKWFDRTKFPLPL